MEDRSEAIHFFIFLEKSEMEFKEFKPQFKSANPGLN